MIKKKRQKCHICKFIQFYCPHSNFVQYYQEFVRLNVGWTDLPVFFKGPWTKLVQQGPDTLLFLQEIENDSVSIIQLLFLYINHIIKRHVFSLCFFCNADYCWFPICIDTDEATSNLLVVAYRCVELK